MIVAQHRDRHNNLSGIKLSALSQGLQRVYKAAKKCAGENIQKREFLLRTREYVTRYSKRYLILLVSDLHTLEAKYDKYLKKKINLYNSSSVILEQRNQTSVPHYNSVHSEQ